MDREILEALSTATDGGARGVLSTIVGRQGSTPQRVGAKMWVSAAGETLGTVGGGDFERTVGQRAAEMLASGQETDLLTYRMDADGATDRGLLCGGTTTVYLELVGRRRQLVVFGAGHVGAALARLGEFCGYAVALWDDRSDYPAVAMSQAVRVFHGSIEETLSALAPDQGCYLVACTWGHQKDLEVLRAALTDWPRVTYVGLMASSRKAAFVKTRLMEEGLDEAAWERVWSPVGLDIGGATPQEIALSIMAQIVALDQGKLVPDGPRRHV